MLLGHIEKRYLALQNLDFIIYNYLIQDLNAKCL